jgi:hypothetical protein
MCRESELHSEFEEPLGIRLSLRMSAVLIWGNVASGLSRFEKGKREFSSSDPTGDFCGNMDNSTCRNESKITSKFEKHYVSRSPHLLHSQYISPCDF